MHSNNHRALTDLPWYRDLKLAEMGQEYLHLPMAVAMLFRDGSSLIWYTDVERTCASLERFSAKDVRTFREVNARYAAVHREVFLLEHYSPPVPFEPKRALLERSAVGRLYLEYQPHSIQEVVCGLFESAQIRALLTFMCVIQGYEVDAKGLGFVLPALIASGLNIQISRGTGHRLAHSLHKMVVKAGAEVLEGQEVVKILLDGGRAMALRAGVPRFVLKGARFPKV